LQKGKHAQSHCSGQRADSVQLEDACAAPAQLAKRDELWPLSDERGEVVFADADER
jgi:hypothetical protein